MVYDLCLIPVNEGLNRGQIINNYETIPSFHSSSLSQHYTDVGNLVVAIRYNILVHLSMFINSICTPYLPIFLNENFFSRLVPVCFLERN